MKTFAPTAPGAAVILAAVVVGAFAIPASASTGVASYYGPGFAGKKTASGERFNPGGLTAAHRSLPFGTRLKLTNLANGRVVIVRVNDRGPFVGGRVLDVSHGAARVLGMTGAGTARLQIEHLGRGQLAQAETAPAPRAGKAGRGAAPAIESTDDLAAQRLEERRNQI